MTYLLFFLSGLSGLIYQTVWVRTFGNVFGNTVYSASIVVAVFMLGLGAGSYVAGAWADRRYSRDADRDPSAPHGLLRAYGYAELAIAAMGAGIAFVLPHLGVLSAAVSAYVRESSGWYALSTGSYVARGAIAVVLLTPVALVMGGTLTILIRHLVRRDLSVGGWRIALLYGINTAGAALGAALTDFALVPAAGLWGAQMAAAFSNVAAGAGALYLARGTAKSAPAERPLHASRPRTPTPAKDPAHAESPSIVVWTSVALALSGFVALGMEILWFRHFSVLLGGFRAVFSLLLTLILAGIAIGSLLGGVVERRTGRPGQWLIVTQTLFVAFTIAGLWLADVDAINRGDQTPMGPTGSASAGALQEIWFNLRPMLPEVAIPALLMGFSFPLANALVQRAERAVGRRAGVLYLANTAGAVGGSLATGLLLLPTLGLQQSTTVLMALAILAVAPLQLAARTPRSTLVASLIVAVGALGFWLRLPGDYVILRALGTPAPGVERLVVRDGLTELIAVTDTAGKGRTLVTNGHSMSSTWPMAQRYMRALVHIPLLAMERPDTVLVIGFGVGNTTHAATLHPSVGRVDLADLSRDVLAHAAYFDGANQGVLHDPRVSVYINDGRQHLQMQAAGAYDLVALEPPPIAYAGVASLYSAEFYALARTRLKPGGYVSQWLPAYQVPPESTLAMVRAFVDVFPQSVLVSGAGNDLLLLGINGPRIEIDPARVADALARAPAARSDLARLDFAEVHEIIGAFLGSAATLADATRGAEPVVDDRPLQEYGVKSMLSSGYGVPVELLDLARLSDWCPTCFVNGSPAPEVPALGDYVALLQLAYAATPAEVAVASGLADREGRRVAGSAYLGGLVPESAELHNQQGIRLAQQGQLAAAVVEFRRALALAPDDSLTHWHLGAALVSQGEQAEATRHLLRSVELDPGNSRALSDLGLSLAVQGRLDEAEVHLRRALELDPSAEEARRNLALVEARRTRR